MNDSLPLYIQIYDKISDKIFVGEYPAQSKLPSLLDICDMYDVSRITARAAVQKLSDDGLVHMQRGRTATVATIDELRERGRYDVWLSRRYPSIHQLCEIDRLSLPDLVVFLAHCADKSFVAEADAILRRYKSANARDCCRGLSEFYILLAKTSGNELIESLVRDKFDFVTTAVVAISDFDEFINSQFHGEFTLLRRILGLIVSQSYDELYDLLTESIGFFGDLFNGYAKPFYDGIGSRQYDWKMKKNNNFYYSKFSDDMIIRIACGFFKNGDLLPSEQKLTERYGVSLISVRKGLKRLSELGVIKTVNGKGSFVTYNEAVGPELEPERLEFVSRRMTEAIQCLALLIKSFSAKAFENSSDSTRSDLIYRIKQISALEKRTYIQVPMIMSDFVSYFIGYDIMGEAMSQMEALICRWVYYNSATSSVVDSRYRERILELDDMAVKSLRDADSDTFAKAGIGHLRILMEYLTEFRQNSGFDNKIVFPFEE